MPLSASVMGPIVFVLDDSNGLKYDVAPWRRGGEAGDRNGPKGHISAEAGNGERRDVIFSLST